jgi:hypothetical protein
VKERFVASLRLDQFVSDPLVVISMRLGWCPG